MRRDSQLILTDCDGCMLDWEWAFRVWMQEHGYSLAADTRRSYYLHHHYNDLTQDEAKRLVHQFNESAAIGFLPALRDAAHYVERLHKEHGFQFRVITSLSLDPNAQKLRRMNLEKIFGSAIADVIFLDCGADKDEVLAQYQGTGLYWIEDRPKNADDGYQVGLKSILLEHEHNADHQCPYPIVTNWSEIYNIITTDS